jgi:hypothetical protein
VTRSVSTFLFVNLSIEIKINKKPVVVTQVSDRLLGEKFSGIMTSGSKRLPSQAVPSWQALLDASQNTKPVFILTYVNNSADREHGGHIRTRRHKRLSLSG